MNAKKTGLVGAGVLTALLAVSPLAWATDHHESPAEGKACAFDGGDAAAASEISGASGGNFVGQIPFGGNNALNAGNCSEFLNDNGNGNGSGNTYVLLPPGE